MKKLLALMLCLMLLSCAVSAGSAVYAASGVDLYPVVEQMNKLYAAYGRLAGATLFVNSYKGFQDLGVQDPGQYLDYNSFVSDAPFSYEGLYERVGYQMSECYNEAARNVIDNATAEYNRVCTEITNNMVAAANNMVASVMASLPTFP